MEFGKHKTLDYLNLSLNLPLNFNELSIFSSKYTKALHDFLRIKPNLRDVQNISEKRKVMLRNLNNICYLNNHLYNSDANETDFKKSGINFIKAHIGTKSLRGNNQQIMIVNLKAIIKVIRKKFMGEEEDAKESQDEESFEDNDYEEEEEVKFEKRSSSASRGSQEGLGLKRRLSKLADGDDYEDMNGLKKIVGNGRNRVNKPKVMKVRGASGIGEREKEMFEHEQ